MTTFKLFFIFTVLGNTPDKIYFSSFSSFATCSWIGSGVQHEYIKDFLIDVPLPLYIDYECNPEKHK
jgi:hypothetical protein